MLQDIVFQDNVLDEVEDCEPAGPEDDGLGPARVAPGTVALIVAALLGGGQGQDAVDQKQRGRTGLWKRVGLLELMAVRQNWR